MRAYGWLSFHSLRILYMMVCEHTTHGRSHFLIQLFTGRPNPSFSTAHAHLHLFFTPESSILLRNGTKHVDAMVLLQDCHEHVVQTLPAEPPLIASASLLCLVPVCKSSVPASTFAIRPMKTFFMCGYQSSDCSFACKVAAKGHHNKLICVLFALSGKLKSIFSFFSALSKILPRRKSVCRWKFPTPAKLMVCTFFSQVSVPSTQTVCRYKSYTLIRITPNLRSGKIEWQPFRFWNYPI